MRMTHWLSVAMLALPFGAAAEPLRCDLSQYKPSKGLTAAIAEDLLVVTWQGDRGRELRMRLTVSDGRPVIRDLAIRNSATAWAVLGEGLTPEYHVVTGVRRMTTQQADPLRAAGVEITEEVIDKNRWYAFWDAPLEIPAPVAPGGRGGASRVLGGPRSASEIRRADATFSASSCRVRTDGASLEVSFPGLTMGIFAGELRFTVYRGTNLIRMDAIAKTSEKWVAYKYDAGLGGFSTALTPRVAWRDTGGHPQQYAFGGIVNQSMVPLKAANRVLVAEGKSGSVAAFTPPHTYFFTREVDTNLGYVWYRKDDAGRFAFGIRQAEREEVQQYVDNFALFNAPPGTEQRMGVYFYASA